MGRHDHPDKYLLYSKKELYWKMIDDLAFSAMLKPFRLFIPLSPLKLGSLRFQ